MPSLRQDFQSFACTQLCCLIYTMQFVENSWRKPKSYHQMLWVPQMTCGLVRSLMMTQGRLSHGRSLATLARHGRMYQLKTNPSRLTGFNGTVCHYLTVSFAGRENRKQVMRSVGSLLYPPTSETTSSMNYTPWRLRGTWVSTKR